MAGRGQETEIFLRAAHARMLVTHRAVRSWRGAPMLSPKLHHSVPSYTTENSSMEQLFATVPHVRRRLYVHKILNLGHLPRRQKLQFRVPDPLHGRLFPTEQNGVDLGPAGCCKHLPSGTSVTINLCLVYPKN